MSGSILRIEDLARLPEHLRGGVVAIGNFDGVHRGHVAVLNTALKEAATDNLPAVVLTFEPHPRVLFSPDKKLSRITPAAIKSDILGALGFDAVIELPFTRDFSQQSADSFVDDVLVSGLGAKHVVTGFDFHFGKGRQGGPAFLMAAGESRGFDVLLVDAFRDADALVISSSRIRAALETADLQRANALLGYRYKVSAMITHGEQLGRTLGYPTANMALPADTPLAHGIYAVRFQRANGDFYDGVASYGRRPTVTDDGAPLLETYVFDFDDDLYGEACSVSLVQYLRGEEKFDGLDPLIAQMNTDAENARAALKDLKPLSKLDQKLTFAEAKN